MMNSNLKKPRKKFRSKGYVSETFYGYGEESPQELMAKFMNYNHIRRDDIIFMNGDRTYMTIIYEQKEIVKIDGDA